MKLFPSSYTPTRNHSIFIKKFFNIFKNKQDFLGDKVKTPDIE